MLEIKLKDVDELHNILMEISMLTYLKLLVQYDTCEKIFNEEVNDSIRKSTEFFLLDKQFETVKKFKSLIEKEDFTRHIKIINER